MKKIFALGFFVTSFVSLAILISAAGAASIARADATIDGTSCDFSGQGPGSGRMLGGVCIASSAYVSQSNPQTGPAQTGTPSGFTALAPIPGLTDAQATSVLNGNTLALFFNNLYKYLIGLAATLAVIEIIWAGLDMSFFHKDAVSAITDDKGRIYNAIFGLILVLSPVLVFSIINPSILNLSLNLPPIKLDIPVGVTGGNTGDTTPVPDPTSGCTAVSGTKGILQVAICPSADASSKWGQQNCGDPSLALYTTSKSNSSNGVATYIATCSGTKDYAFVSQDGFFTLLIDQMLPLVSIPTNPNNGAEAMSFANICQSAGLGLQTCIDSDPAFASFYVTCTVDPAGPNAQTQWKCYPEKLTCRDASTLNRYCKSNPSWTPFR